MNQEELKDMIDSMVSAEISKSVKLKTSEPVEESLTAELVGIGASIIGLVGGVAVAGAAAVASANPLVAFAALPVGLAGAAAGSVLRDKINDSQFRSKFDALQNAIAERDMIIKQAADMRGDQQQKVDFLKQHKRDLKKATEKQKKAAASLRKFVNDSSNSKYLSTLSQSEFNYVKKMISVGENGLLTNDIQLAGKVY